MKERPVLARVSLGSGCFWTLVLLVGAAARPLAAAEGFLPWPELDATSDVSIAAGEAHRRLIDLEAGDALQLEVTQRGIDLEVVLQDPVGRTLLTIDSPNGRFGTEQLLAVAPVAGRFQLNIEAPAGSDPGAYQVRLSPPQPADAEFRAAVAADRADRQGWQHMMRGSHRQAAEAFTSALDTWRRQHRELRRAETAALLCQVMIDLGRASLAASLCEEAFPYYRDHGPPQLLTTTLLTGSTAWLRIASTEKALNALREAEPLLHAHGSPGQRSILRARFAAAYDLQGEIHRALSEFEAALEIAKHHGLAAQEAHVGADMAALLLQLRRPEEAVDLLRRVETVYQQRNDLEKLGVVERYLAEAHRQLGELSSAETMIRSAIGRHYSSPNLRIRSLDFYTLGQILQAQGNLLGARKALVNVLELAKQLEDPAGEALFSAHLGTLEVISGEETVGFGRLSKACDKLLELDSYRGQVICQARSAQALLVLGRPREAWTHMAEAFRHLEHFRAGLSRRDLRLTYFDFRRDYLHIGLEILAALEQRDPGQGWALEALVVHDRLLARELLDPIGRSPGGRTPGGRTPGGRSPGGSQQILEEQVILSQLRREPLAPKTKRELLARLHRFRGLRSNPAESPPPLGLADLQSMLDGNTLALIYAPGPHQTLLWVLSKNTLDLVKLPAGPTIEALASDFVEELARPRTRSQERAKVLGRELYETLLAPAGHHLAARRLVFVGEGILRILPFAALVTHDDPVRYLVEDHEIVVLPSLSTLAAFRRREAQRASPDMQIAVFADPVFDRGDPRLTTNLASSEPLKTQPPDMRLVASGGLQLRATDSPPIKSLDRLPGAGREAETIRRNSTIDQTFIATGLLANREIFFSSDPSRFRNLHFATHGIRAREGELAGLALSRVDARGNPRVGTLHAFEISELRLSAGLVVLSACETARGPLYRGEGPIGLTWAFLQAGASRVLSTLWRVGDQKTAQFMNIFYRSFLGEARAPAAAARQAQIALLSLPDSNPFDWSGFLFTGDWRPSPHPEISNFETEAR